MHDIRKEFLAVISIIFALFPVVLLAQVNPSDSIDPKAFVDWFVLSDLLKSRNNIDVTYVNWQVIEPLCLPLKTENSDVPYNKCRYDKAVLMQQFRSDTNTCNQQATLKYPDSLKTNPPVTMTTVTDPNGRTKVIQNSTPYTDATLKAARNSQFFDCMLGLGWRSPNDWTAGKH